MKKVIKNIINFFGMINQKYKALFNTKLKLLLQFFPSNIYLFVLAICMFVIITPKVLNNKICVYGTEYGTIIPDEIVDKSIYQDIETKGLKRINELGIKFSTYMRKNDSIYKLIVYKNDEVFYKKKIESKTLKDNEFKIFKINKKINKDDKYKFEVKPVNVKKGNGITISTDENNDYTYRLYDVSPLYNLVVILSVVFLIIFFILNALINNGKIKSEEHFYKLMIIYIVLITLVFPPLFEPDSAYHFDRAYTVSQNNIVDFIKSNTLKRETYPSNLKCLNYGNDNTVINEVTDTNKIKKCFDSKKLIKKKITKLTVDNKIAFAFSGLGIKIAMLFTNSPMIIFYMGRLFNSIVSFLIILFALKVAPKHKRILLSIVMIPVFLQQMCSYSYDSFLNSLCILVIAYLIKFFNDDSKIRKRDLIIYLISIVCIFITKLPYVLVGAPILFVSKEKFGSKKISKLLYLFIMATLIGLAFIIPRLGETMAIVDTSGSDGRGMPLSSLFNIKYTIKLIYYTFSYNFKFYLETFIGGLAWLNGTYINKLFIYFYLLFVCFGVASEKQSMHIKKVHKILMILINIALIGGIFLAMYLAWTTPDSKAVEGVQGRYLFAPILGLLLCLIPKNNKISISNETFYSFFNISCVVYLITMLYLFY